MDATSHIDHMWKSYYKIVRLNNPHIRDERKYRIQVIADGTMLRHKFQYEKQAELKAIRLYREMQRQFERMFL